jgi:hypothetical protein
MLINRDNPPAAHSPGYMPLEAAAQWAGVSVRTLKRWINRGLPRYQAGPRERVLVRPVDIEHFLTRQQKPSPNLDEMVDEVFQGMLKS